MPRMSGVLSKASPEKMPSMSNCWKIPMTRILRKYPGQCKRLIFEDPSFDYQVHESSFLENKRQLYPIAFQVDAALQLHMFAKIQFAPAIPFEDGFFCVPDEGEEFLEDPPPQPPLFEKKRIVFVKEMNFLVIEEF